MEAELKSIQEYLNAVSRNHGIDLGEIYKLWNDDNPDYSLHPPTQQETPQIKRRKRRSRRK